MNTVLFVNATIGFSEYLFLDLQKLLSKLIRKITNQFVLSKNHLFTDALYKIMQ